jgi:hypothetical protein
MISFKRRSIPMTAAAVAAALSLGTAAARGQVVESQPSQQQLLDQVRALQARVQQLETTTASTRQAVDAGLVDHAVAEAARDAQARGQPLQSSGFTAGYTNGKFVIQSEDGNFLLNPGVQLQFRYIGNYRQETKNGNAESDDYQGGFVARRVKFNLEGNVFNKETKYKFQWATNRTSGALELEEAWVSHAFGSDLAGGALTGFGVRAGTFKDPVYHEELTSSKRQLAVERSLVNQYLGGEGFKYEQGVTVFYDAKDSPLRAEVGYTDGGRTNNTNFTDTGGYAVFGITNTTFGVLGRVEYKLLGETWKAYDDFSARQNTDDLLVVGGGFNWNEGDNGDVVGHTVDVQWEPQAVPGLTVYGAYLGVYRDFHTVAAGVEDKPYDWGLLAQAGYLLPGTNLEVYGRYAYLSLDDQAPAGTGTLGAAARASDTLHEITVGANYYLKGHASKITVDAVYLPNGSPLDANSLGILPQGNDNAQFVFRAQYQLLL